MVLTASGMAARRVRRSTTAVMGKTCSSDEWPTLYGGYGGRSIPPKRLVQGESISFAVVKSRHQIRGRIGA
jgi:hypothetical protein